MREIKFRAWDEESLKMHYPVNKPRTQENIDDELIIQFDCTGYSARTSTKYIGDKYLMEFTGLKDKNGKEIYEGDILSTINRIPNQNDKIIVVIFNMGAFWAGNNLMNENFLKFSEVIGNIYQNPELLEAK
jgi:uncharacterized phage protein (TIGR01671 family)